MTILFDFLLLFLFYRDYRVVGTVRAFFFELKHDRKGFGDAKISKIRHMGEKRRRFGLFEKKTNKKKKPKNARGKAPPLTMVKFDKIFIC